jgi:hypothetical protein
LGCLIEKSIEIRLEILEKNRTLPYALTVW